MVISFSLQIKVQRKHFDAFTIYDIKALDIEQEPGVNLQVFFKVFFKILLKGRFLGVIWG